MNLWCNGFSKLLRDHPCITDWFVVLTFPFLFVITFTFSTERNRKLPFPHFHKKKLGTEVIETLLSRESPLYILRIWVQFLNTFVMTRWWRKNCVYLNRRKVGSFKISFRQNALTYLSIRLNFLVTKISGRSSLTYWSQSEPTLSFCWS